MQGKPDLTIVQTEEPAGRWCSSGHFPPDTFILDGETISMRFFNIQGKGIDGIFCELCLSIANKFKKKK
jgi:hypothetical protein